jgi:hypothetical protein
MAIKTSLETFVHTYVCIYGVYIEAQYKKSSCHLTAELRP